MELIGCIVLSNELPKSWGSIKNLINNYLKENIGETEEAVNKFLETKTEEIRNKLELMSKIINRFIEEKIISKDNKLFNKFYIPYKFMICRLSFKLKDISVFNRHIKNILDDFKTEILDEEKDIQNSLGCKSRNAIFQRKLIVFIDKIIDKHYDKKDVTNNKFFYKKTIMQKLQEQNNKCNICHCDLSNMEYDGDHINPWCNEGKTEYSNSQVLCKHCHRKKN